jgi:hypothetical protein
MLIVSFVDVGVNVGSILCKQVHPAVRGRG